jgi:hypothetical protein
MKIVGILLLCSLAWHQPNKPDWQAGKANAIAHAADYSALATISDYYAQNEASPPKEQPPKWYARSWAPEWALFIVGFGGIWVAISTLNHLRKSSERQLRAYVLQENAALIDGTMLNPPQPARAGIPGTGMLIKNFGQTPAYHVVSWAQIAVIWVATENMLVFPPMHSAFYNTLGPGATFNKVLWFDRPLTAIEIADIAAATRAIYVHGRIEYQDAFGKKRFTNFRLRYSGVFPPPAGATLNFSESGNDAD